MRYGINRILPRYSGGVRKWDYGRAVPVRAVFIHIMEGNLSGSDSWFRNPASGTTSTHFGIGYANWVDRTLRRVSVYQWVDTVNTAWGTGVTRYPISSLAQSILGPLISKRIDVNHGIIHIEVEGYPYRAWPSGFISALNNLLAALGRAHGPLMVMRHNDVSSKVCPGLAPWGSIRPSYGQRLTAYVPPAPTPPSSSTIHRADGAPPTMRFRARNDVKVLRNGKPIRDGASVNAKILTYAKGDQSVRVVGEMKPTGSYDPWYVFAYYLGNGHAFVYAPGVDFR